MLSRIFLLSIGLSGLLPSASQAEPAREPGLSPSASSLEKRHALSLEEINTALTSDTGSLRAWVTRLESSVSQGTAKEFDAFVKAEWLLDAITRPVAIQAQATHREVEEAFTHGTRASWAQRSLANDYLGHHFRFLRAHILGGRPGLLFRSAGENGQLNYCLLTVARGPDGTLGADDVYVAGMAEWVSDTLRRGYLTLVESLNPRGESGRRASLYVAALPRITAMHVALAQKDYARVLALSALLPPEVRQDRQILLTRLEAAENLSMEERFRVFAEWKALHPNPEQLPLKWADFHLAAGLFSEARTVLAQLNERLGGDSHLMLRLGEIKMLAAHYAAGRLLGGRPEPEGNTPDRAQNEL